jgi:recombination protein RecA
MPKKSKKDNDGTSKALKRREQFTSELVDTLNKSKSADEHPTQVLGSEGLARRIRGVISTQCPSIDLAIGRGGVPLSRVVLVHGPEGSGKTTLALHLIAETMRRGGLCSYIDAEYKLDPDYAQAIGVNTDHLVLSQPPYLERGMQMMEQSIKMAGRYREEEGVDFPVLVVLDSINALGSKALKEGDYEAYHMATEARIWSQSLKKLVPELARENVCLLLISQERVKPGVLFGKKRYPAGGEAPRYYSSLTMEIARKKKEDDEGKGWSVTEVYVSKNQIAKPFKRAQFNIVYGKGIDYEESLLREAVAVGVVEQGGSWFRYGKNRIGQGATKATDYLRKSPAVVDEIATKLGLESRHG